jgi:hypothetical protein
MKLVTTDDGKQTPVVFHRDPSDPHVMTIDAVSPAADIIDSLEDQLREARKDENLRDLIHDMVENSRCKLMAEILLKLICLLGDADDIRLQLEVLISASGLSLRNEADSAIAARFGLTRAAFSARKRTVMRELGLQNLSSKSPAACATYRLTNRKNSSFLK